MAEYIEREAALEAIKLYGLSNGSSLGHHSGAVELTEQEIATIPAADVAPVLHGEWESFTTSAYIGLDEYGEPKWAERRFFVHKKCGRRSAIQEPYCPSCGAKMERVR